MMPAKKKIKIESGDHESKAEKAVPPDSDAPNDNAQNQYIDDAAKTADTNVDADADTMKELEEQLEAATAEAKETYDKFLRVSAELENYKKRVAREMEDLRKFANQSLIKNLLPVLDNLELAIKSSAEGNNSESSLLDGVELTRKEILKVFEKFSVEQIEALGKAFDPRFHEAVMQEETDKHPGNTVINELQKGYLMHDRLIRPSMVVVAMPKNQQNGQEDNNSTDQDT